MIGERMPENLVLFMARRGANYVAGAFNLLGKDTIYGRNWGSYGEYKFLHFECCYYQAIEFAITRGLKRVEAGAQGPHKIQRGYLPVLTYSAHWIPDPAFRRAVAQFLARERQMIEHKMEGLGEFSPFRHEETACPSQQEERHERADHSTSRSLDQFWHLWHRFGRALIVREGELVLVGFARHADDPALRQLPEQELLGERLFDVLLDDARERTCAEQRVIAFGGEPIACARIELDRDVTVRELLLELQHELIDDPTDCFRRQRCE